MSSTETWTIGRLLNWTKEFLTEKGSDTARLDAEILLAAARQCERIELYTCFDELAEESVRIAFRELVRRRAEGTPVAYLVGHKEFYSMSFRVNDHVLIPRPETEFVVMALLDRAKDSSASPRILDVGTGSGILAVCAAKLVSGADVTAVDISSSALEVAQCNARDHDVESIRFVESDLLSQLSDESQYDFIISNPPYVSEAEYHQLRTEVKDQEPSLALIGGPNGTEIIERLIPQAVSKLNPGGWLIVELSPMIYDSVHQSISENGSFGKIETIKDLAGHKRVIAAMLN